MADFGVSEYLAIASLATTAVGAGVAAHGARVQAEAQQQAMVYQAAVAKNNQAIAEQYADAEVQKGARLEEAKRLETGQREGMIRAAVGASGIDVNSGSSVRLQEDTAKLGDLDALTIRNNSMRAAYGFRVQGLGYASQASLDMMGAESAGRAGTLGAWSSIIGGASSVSDKWLSFRRQGIFNNAGGPS